MDPAIWKQGREELNRDRSQLALVVQALEQTAPLAAKLTGHDSFSLDEGRLALQLIELVLHIQKESAVIHEVVAALGGLCETGWTLVLRKKSWATCANALQACSVNVKRSSPDHECKGGKWTNHLKSGGTPCSSASRN